MSEKGKSENLHAKVQKAKVGFKAASSADRRLQMSAFIAAS